MPFKIDRLNWIIKKLELSSNVHLVVNDPELESITDYEVCVEISDELIRRGLCHEAIQALNKAEELIKDVKARSPDFDLRYFYEEKADSIFDICEYVNNFDRSFFLQIGLNGLLKIIQIFPDGDNRNIWRKIAEVRCALGQTRYEVLLSLVNAFDDKGELKGALKLSDNLVKKIGYEDVSDVISLADLAEMQLIKNKDGALALEVYAIALRNLNTDVYRAVVVRMLQNFIFHARVDLCVAIDEIDC